MDEIDKRLQQLGIYELRNLARNMGVKSPTTKRRDELIEAIKNIKSGDLEPTLKSHLGRPVKIFTEQDDLINMMMSDSKKETKSLLDMPLEHHTPKPIVFAQSFPTNVYGLDMVQVAGVLRKAEDGSFYAMDSFRIGKRMYIMVEDNMIERFQLKAGDFIEGSAYVNDSNSYVKLAVIDRINLVKTDELGKYQEQELIIPKRILDFPDFKMGYSKLEELDNADAGIQYIHEKVMQFQEMGVKCVLLGLEISVETKLQFNSITNAIQVVSLYDSVASVSYETVHDAINNVNTMFNRGDDVALFVLDMLNIYDVLDVYYKTFQNHCEEAEMLVRSLLGVAKASEKASISVFGIYYKYQAQSFQRELANIKRITK